MTIFLINVQNGTHNGVIFNGVDISVWAEPKWHTNDPIYSILSQNQDSEWQKHFSNNSHFRYVTAITTL